MIPRKTLPIILGVSLLLPSWGYAQVLVFDGANAQIALEHSLQELVKLAVMIEEIQTTKNWLGDAAGIRSLAGLDDVFVSLRIEGVGEGRLEIALQASSAEGANYAGDGLYAAVGESYQSRNGLTIQRSGAFKPEAAVFNAVQDHDHVAEDVKVRRANLKHAIEETLAQLRNASTHAEVLKALGVLLAEHADLDATDRELTFSSQQAELFDIQNRADKDRQEKARQQEQAHEFSEGLRLFSNAVRPLNFVR